MTERMLGILLATVGLIGLQQLLPVSAHAHALAPSLLELRESAGADVSVLWKTPRLQATGSRVRPKLPASCEPVAPRIPSRTDGGVAFRWSARCGELVGARIGVVGLERSRTDVIVRVEFRDGRRWSTVLSPAESDVIIPPRSGRLELAGDYAVVGFEHVISGPDHLLFVLGLLLLISSTRLRIGTISAFTLGHSITLALAALGIVWIPAEGIELAIAASIFALAVELAREPGAASGWGRHPWGMAAGFGLLHGFGFAGALERIGLPQADLPLALGAFNLGIEAGQLAFVAFALATMQLIRPIALRAPAVAANIPSYVVGSIAAYWLFDRSAALLWIP